jgi:hypothetical protein
MLKGLKVGVEDAGTDDEDGGGITIPSETLTLTGLEEFLPDSVAVAEIMVLVGKVEFSWHE